MKTARRIKRINILVISVSAILLILLSACGSPQSETTPAASGNISSNTTQIRSVQPPPIPRLPPEPYPDKGNPKLDGFLNGLILAEQRGEAESFARQRKVELVDGKVRVEIEAMPGQLDVAANVTALMGTVELVVPGFNYFQAIIPITSLTALTEQKSIRMISNPEKPSAQ